MEITPEKFAHIKGWGIDADPKNDPTYPMRDRMNVAEDPEWVRPTLQPETVEVLHSNERPNLSAVFGTTSPPSGLSGMIRRMAFTNSENEYGHWLPLVLADRINVVEGVIEDIAHGIFPNILAEKGYKGKFKHDKAAAIYRVAMGTLLTVGVIALLTKGGKKKKKVKGQML
ncbi:hypothetical protein [Adhaeribacter terreus]|uniref:Uncharacterized protein n=1 Tax=Adhaeribacter terreus TaxID=529703 RepID=A0ABW0EIG6_9BACT